MIYSLTDVLPVLLLLLLLLLLLPACPPAPTHPPTHTCTHPTTIWQLYIGNLAAGQVTEGMLQQVFNSALIAAFPDAGKPGQEPVIKVRRGGGVEAVVGFG